MNKYIVAICLLFSVSALAGESCSEQSSDEVATSELEIETDVPNYLKGATITVKLANGKETTVPAERFKVVPRLQQFITTHTERTTLKTCSNNAPRRNRITVLGGHGNKGGLTTTTSGTTTEVESKVGLVGGGQYSYLLPALDDRLSVTGQAQTNKAFSIGLGLEF